MYGKFFGSSIDQNRLALTWKGALVGSLPTIVFVAKLAGVDLTEELLVEVVNGIVAFVSACMVLVGLGRKILIMFENRNK